MIGTCRILYYRNFQRIVVTQRRRQHWTLLYLVRRVFRAAGKYFPRQNCSGYAPLLTRIDSVFHCWYEISVQRYVVTNWWKRGSYLGCLEGQKWFRMAANTTPHPTIRTAKPPTVSKSEQIFIYSVIFKFWAAYFVNYLFRFLFILLP